MEVLFDLHIHHADNRLPPKASQGTFLQRLPSGVARIVKKGLSTYKFN